MDNFENIDVYQSDLIFNAPTRVLVFGASNSGKTCLVENLVRLNHNNFHKIIICGTKNKLLDFKETAPITQHYTPRSKSREDQIYDPFPDVEDLNENNIHSKQILLIYDDLLDIVYKSNTIANIFVKGRHHNLSIILILQSFFPKGSGLNLTTLFKSNATHYIFTRNASLGEMRCIATFIEYDKECKKFFLDLYKKIVLGVRHGYICVQLDVCNERLKYISNLLNEDLSGYISVHGK